MEENVTSLQQREAKDLFEGNPNRPVDGPDREMRDGEPYVYRDGADVGSIPEEFPDRRTKDPEALTEFHSGHPDEVKPRYLVQDGGEESIVVPKEVL